MRMNSTDAGDKVERSQQVALARMRKPGLQNAGCVKGGGESRKRFQDESTLMDDDITLSSNKTHNKHILFCERERGKQRMS